MRPPPDSWLGFAASNTGSGLRPRPPEPTGGSATPPKPLRAGDADADPTRPDDWLRSAQGPARLHEPQ